MDRALGYSRRVATETDNVLVRALVNEREYFRDAVRIRFAPYAPNVTGSPQPHVLAESMATTPGIRRTLYRFAKDAHGVESGPLRVSDAASGCLAKCNVPTSKKAAQLSTARARDPSSRSPSPTRIAARVAPRLRPSPTVVPVLPATSRVAPEEDRLFQAIQERLRHASGIPSASTPVSGGIPALTRD